MKITDNEIERIVNSKRNLELSKRYDENDLVDEFSIYKNKENYFVEGYVTKASYNNEVHLTLNAYGLITDYKCSCPYCKEDGACAHIGALLYKLQEVDPVDFPYFYNKKTYETARIINDEIRKIKEERERKRKEQEALRERLHQEMLMKERTFSKNLIFDEKQALLKQIMPISNIDKAVHIQISNIKKMECYGYYDLLGLYVELRIGAKRMYVIKNVEDFLENVRQEAFISYGKELAFQHTREAFEENSLRIIDFLIKCSNKKPSYVYCTDKRYMRVPMELMDEFFSLIQTLTEEDCAVRWNKKKQKLQLQLGKEKDDYLITLLSPRKRFDICGLSHFYVLNEQCLTQMYMDDLGKCMRLYRSLCDHEYLRISLDDIDDFCRYILLDCESFIDMKNKEQLPEIMVEKGMKLYADINDDGMVEIFVDCLLEEGKIKGFDQSVERKPVNLEIVENYLEKYTDRIDYDHHIALMSSKSSNTQGFLMEGLANLSYYCDVFVSDALQAFNSSKKINLSYGVRVKNNLLEIDINSTDIKKDEIYDVLRAYRKKKSFHRLQDGRILSLESEELKEADVLLNDLNVPLQDIKSGKLKLPSYRAFYLDDVSKKENAIEIDRSRTFDQFIENFHKIKKANIPQHYEEILRDYQKEGVYWLHWMNQLHFGAILADDMGLGKTLQVITVLDMEKAENRCSLVVSPSSLLLNWKDEVEKFSEDLVCECVMGTSAQREEIISNYQKFDLLITSYDYLRRDAGKYEDKQFYYIILDEAQYIKNHKTKNAVCVKQLQGEHHLALTGTPIENSLAELWSIFDFLIPNYLYNYHHFKINYEKDITVSQDEEKSRKLKQMISPFILRRVKTQVLQELPEKVEHNTILSFSEEESKLYFANLVKANEDLQKKLAIDEGKPDKFMILAMLTKLRQICCEPRLVFENITKHSSKLNGCMELISTLRENHQKILLFSSFTTMLDLIAEELASSHICYLMLTGKTKKEERHELVSRFQEGEADVFLISLKAGGTGLNLTAATAVIHYDPWWNVSAQNQASDRAYRIGQNQNVQVYKLIMKDSIEEKIQKMQERKKNLADTFVEGNDGSIQNMTMEEIMGLLSMDS